MDDKESVAGAVAGLRRYWLPGAALLLRPMEELWKDVISPLVTMPSWAGSWATEMNQRGVWPCIILTVAHILNIECPWFVH